MPDVWYSHTRQFPQVRTHFNNRLKADVLVHGRGRAFVKTVGLIDTGADFTLITDKISNSLGFNLHHCPPVTFRAAAGTSHTYNFARVKLSVCGFPIQTNALIGPALDVLIGRNTIIDGIKIGLEPSRWLYEQA